MALFRTIVFVATLVAPSYGGAAPVDGRSLGTFRVPFESRSFRSAPLASVAAVERQPVPPAHSTALEKSALLLKQNVITSNRRFNNVLPRAEGIGAPGFPADLAECPGSRRKTCNENGIHRVCLQLLDDRSPITYGFEPDGTKGKDGKDNWRMLDYWSITGKDSFRQEWWAELTGNGGDSRCVGVDSTSILISKVGCEKVNIRCDATDRVFVAMTDQPRTPGLQSLAPIKECFEKQCGPTAPALGTVDVQNGSVLRTLGMLVAGSAAVAAAAFVVQRRTPPEQVETLLG